MKPWYSKRERRIRRFFRGLHPEETLAYSKFYQVERSPVQIEFLDPIPLTAAYDDSPPVMAKTKKVFLELTQYKFGNWFLRAAYLLKTDTLYIQEFYNLHDRDYIKRY